MPSLVRCPSCGRHLRVSDDLLGKRIRCPACGTTFTSEEVAPSPAPAPPPPEEPAPESGRQGEGIQRETGSPGTRREEGAPSRAEEGRSAPTRRRDWEDEEEERRPVRGSRRWEDEEDEDRPYRADRQDAAALVAGPAIGLLVTGGLGIALTLLGLTLNLLGMSLPQPSNAPPMDSAERFGNLVGAGCGAVFGLLLNGFLIYAGIQMKNLRSYGVAMAGSIVALLPCSVCCLLGLPFGIWGLVVLNKPEVQSAFR